MCDSCVNHWQAETICFIYLLTQQKSHIGPDTTRLKKLKTGLGAKWYPVGQFDRSWNTDDAKLYLKLQQNWWCICVADVRLNKTNAEQSTNWHHHGRPRICKYWHVEIHKVWRHWTVENFRTGLTSAINIVKHAYCNKLEFSRMTMFAWTNNSAICIDRCVIDNNKCVVWNHNTTDHPSMANTLSQIFIWNSCLPLACKRHIDRFWLANSDLKFSVAWRWLLV